MTTNSPQTRLSLVQYLCREDQESWQEVDRVYRPMIMQWLRLHGLQGEDSEDVAQEVLAKVVEKIGGFDHNGRVGAFRNWLRLITTNTLQNYVTKAHRRLEASGGSSIRNVLDQLRDENSEVSRQFDRQHDQHVLFRLLEDVSSRFRPDTIELFREHVLKGVAATDVAKQAGVGVHAVYMAKSRVLRELRKEAPGWLDELTIS